MNRHRLIAYVDDGVIHLVDEVAHLALQTPYLADEVWHRDRWV